MDFESFDRVSVLDLTESVTSTSRLHPSASCGLIACITVNLGRRFGSVDSSAKSALAGLLAVLLILLGLMAANDAGHHSFHHDQGQATNPCAVCLLIKGHLESPALTPIVLPGASPLICAGPLELGKVPAFTGLAADSRAPPAWPSLLPVVV